MFPSQSIITQQQWHGSREPRAHDNKKGEELFFYYYIQFPSCRRRRRGQILPAPTIIIHVFELFTRIAPRNNKTHTHSYIYIYIVLEIRLPHQEGDFPVLLFPLCRNIITKRCNRHYLHRAACIFVYNMEHLSAHTRSPPAATHAEKSPLHFHESPSRRARR